MSLAEKMVNPASIQTLQETIQEQILLVREHFEIYDIQKLNFKPGPEKWSILECIEHLNRYARFYHQEIQDGIGSAEPGNGQISWSWMGKKSIESVHPENFKRQNTLKRMNPALGAMDHAVLEEFSKHQEQFLNLLKAGANKNLDGKVVRVEFFKLFKLRLGEAMEFMATHQQRHLNQALRIFME